MATKSNPVKRSVDVPAGGAAQAFTSRVADDGVPNDVIRRIVDKVDAKDLSGADNSIQLEEQDPDAPAILDTWEFEVTANGSITFGKGEVGFYARRGNVIRASGDDEASVIIEFHDER